MKKILFAGCAFLLLASCTTTKNYRINSKSGTQTQGTVNFVQKGKEVTMDVNAYKLSPGKHAIHIHEKGDCSATDGSSAGGHWNPDEQHHGKWEGDHFHRGDIGNLVANKEGYAQLQFKTDKWCLGCKDEKKNIIGKSIVIHDKEDDFKTQPTGNAGGRVGCVEIK